MSAMGGKRTLVAVHLSQYLQPKQQWAIGASVPRYFFDLYNDMDVLDEDGKELPDIDAAKATALCEVREMVLASIADNSELNLCHYINVRDEGGAIVYVMRFQDAVTIKRGGKVLSQPSA